MELGKRLDRPVVLVGLMGVGKSTVGRRLAKRLGLPFVDSDAEIEDASGYPPRKCSNATASANSATASGGWSRGWSKAMSGSSPPVAAPMSIRRTRQLLNERAITIWLDAPVDILAERTSRRDTRAQLRNGDPKAVLERLAQERRPSYAAGAYPREKRRRRPQGRRRCDRRGARELSAPVRG